MKCPKCQNTNERLIDCIALLLTVKLFACVACGSRWEVTR
jgi:hypothetical protein